MGRYFCKQISPFWLDNRDVQGRNEVRWGLGKETSLAPMFKSDVFRKQMYCFEKSAYDIVTFWPPAEIQRPGNCFPFPPRYVCGVMQ